MWAAFVLLSALLGAVGAVTNPEEYVNTLGGADGRFDLSDGNVLPVVTRPWGFNSWAPMTSTSNSQWWFHPNDRQFFGIRCTHQPSPWVGDYGNFLIVPSLTSPQHADVGQYSGYVPQDSAWHPYYFNASLLAYGTTTGLTTVELTSTQHGAVLRVRFPAYLANSGFNQTRRILVKLNNEGSDHIAAWAGGGGGPTAFGGLAAINGSTTHNSGGTTGDFRHYFTITVGGGSNGSTPLKAMSSGILDQAGVVSAYLDFDPTDAASAELTVRVGTSFISGPQSELNHKREVQSMSFDDVMASSKKEWHATLSTANVVDVGSSYTPQEQNDFLTVFYTCLYRATQFPRLLYEENSQGQPIHYSPYAAQGGVFPGVLSTDSGFWDAYRTVYPQLSLLFPSKLGQIIQGWLNAYKEGTWLPKWGSPGYRGGMVGTMGDVSVADAIVKKVPGFNVSLAYQAIRQDAFDVPTCNATTRCGVGRVALADYMKYGYIPRDAVGTAGSVSETVSRTLNYMLSDYAIAQAANLLGHSADASALLQRASQYHLLFDTSTAFFRPKYSNGSFAQPFDELAWGGDYTESGPWQMRFYVPYDAKGLQELYGTAGKKMCAELQAAQTMPSVFHLGGYGHEIHEQTEMPSHCWGQYAHNNQPVHHMLYMFIAAQNGTSGACASQGQYWIRQALTRLYQAQPAMFPGDEDNGEMSSWFILSSLGLYSLAPGTTSMTLGAPLFSQVDVTLDNSAVLHIVAHNNSRTNMYVSGVEFNGQPVRGSSISYFDLRNGGTLEFTMSDTPTQW